MSFAAFVSGVMRPTVDKYKSEQAMKQRLEESAANAKLEKMMNEWEFYTPEERSAAAPELDKVLKQKPGFSADMLGKADQGYKFLKGALDQQKPIQDLEATASNVSQRPVMGQGPDLPGIDLPSEGVKLPPLPIEGADIPRMDQNVLNQTPAQRALAAKQYSLRQNDIATRSSKIAEINASPLSQEDKEAAIESLFLPPGVLSARERALYLGHAQQTKMQTTGKRKFFRIPGPTPETSNVVNYIERMDGTLVDPNTGQPVSLPANAVFLSEHYITSANDQGTLSIINPQAAVGPGNYRANLPDAAKTYHPPVGASASPPSDAEINELADRVKTGELKWTEALGAYPITGGIRANAAQRLNKAMAGNRIAPPKLREQMTALSAAKTLIAPLKKMVADVQAAGANPAERIRATAILENYGKSVSGRIARAFGEVGTMNEGDINRAKGLVPGIIAANFDPEFARREFMWLDSLLASQEKNLREGHFQAIAIPGAQSATPTATSPNTPGAAPRVGEIKHFDNGNIGRWDGKGWKKVN